MVVPSFCMVVQQLTAVKAKAPAALAKYIAAGKDASKLTIKELTSLALVHLHMELTTKKKAAVVIEFKDSAALKQWDPVPAASPTNDGTAPATTTANTLNAQPEN